VLAEALLRARALEVGLAYELIASRNELELIVAATRRGDPEPDVRTLEGWRSELVGADLRDLLAGRRAISVGPGRRLVLQDAPTSSLIDTAAARSNIELDSA
jgi:ribonuclease D